MIFGALNKAELGHLLTGMNGLVSLPITPEISSVMLQLMAKYCLSNRLNLPDALIAATALHHGLPLYTLNRKDFRYSLICNYTSPLNVGFSVCSGSFA